MYLEYDWTFNVWRVRFGQSFISWRGFRSFETKAEATAALEAAGCRIGRKTDTRSWEIVSQ